MLDLLPLDHGDDCVLDGSLGVVSVEQLILESLVGDPGADGDSSLDLFFDFPYGRLELDWHFSALACES